MFHWITTLLQGSWLWHAGVDVFGLHINGWILLLVGVAALTAILVILWNVFRGRVFGPLLLAALIIMPTYVLFGVPWLDLWWPTAFLVVGVAITLFIFFLKLVKWVLVAAIMTAIAVVIGSILGLFGVPPLIGGPSDVCNTTEGKTPETHFYTLDENKESLGAFGNPVTQGDEAGIGEELRTRICADPALLSALSAAAGNIPFNLTSEYTARFQLSRTLWNKVVEKLLEFKQTGLEHVSAGTSTFYMVVEDGKIVVRQGQTIGEGTAVVLMHPDGRVIKLRLDCGFQPVFVTPPPEVPPCNGTDCPPPPCPPGWNGTYPECKGPASEDPGPNGNAPIGEGPNADAGPGAFIPEELMEQPPATPYVAPAGPSPTPTDPGSTPVPVPTVNPEPAPPAETEAPSEEAPAEDCSPAPGKTCPAG